MGMLADSPAGVRRPPGRLYLAPGISLALLGPILYALQLRARILTVPWYMPALGTAAAAVLLAALVRARTLPRVVAVLLVGLVAGAEWWLLVWGTRLPAYAGPVAVGSPFPAFTASRANGSVFSQDDLRGDQNTVLVLFRGRW